MSNTPDETEKFVFGLHLHSVVIHQDQVHCTSGREEKEAEKKTMAKEASQPNK